MGPSSRVGAVYLPTKQCSDCELVKAIEEFPESHPGKPRRRCRPCYNAYQRAHGKRQYRKHHRKLLAKATAYREANPAKVAEGNRRQARQRLHDSNYRARMHPVRVARRYVVQAIKSGALSRPSVCERCDKPCKPDAAHTDYSKPLDVRWLCRGCHIVWDKRSPKTLNLDSNRAKDAGDG